MTGLDGQIKYNKIQLANAIMGHFIWSQPRSEEKYMLINI